MTTYAPSFGSDESTFDANGLPSMGFDRPQITGVRVPLEGCARTIMTPLGALFWDTSQGVRVPIQQLTNMTPTDAELSRIQSEWGAACVAQVEGVTSAVFRITRDSTGKLARVTGSIGLLNAGILPLVGTLAGTAGDAFAFLFPSGTGVSVSPVPPTVPAY